MHLSLLNPALRALRSGLAWSWLWAWAGLAAAQTPPGFTVMKLPADGEHRALEVAVWYPSGPVPDDPTPGHNTDSVAVADNRAFEGVTVRRNAPARPGRFGLVVLSHGSFGYWGNQSWLAPALIQAGHVVVAPNHPGTTHKDRRPEEGAALWQRPRDLTHVMNAFLGDAPALRGPTWHGMAVDEQSVFVVGHSLGGWTALALAGARFDPDLFDADCQLHPELGACRVVTQLNAGARPHRTRLALPMGDARVRGVVLLDAGGTRGFSADSLQRLTTPVLLLAATEPNPQVPLALESQALLKRLPTATTQWEWLAGSSHFSFLQTCKPGAEALLEADTPGDGIICQDGPGADRNMLHQR
ncbi:MAG TPA: alpha/beta fold hydrolase, partial [Burkholderiaceae bacterium]|nr:alpha/beta fold hydrolase [Burkholderiaceae bacterium]